MTDTAMEIIQAARDALADAYKSAGLPRIAQFVRCGDADQSTHTPALLALSAVIARHIPQGGDGLVERLRADAVAYHESMYAPDTDDMFTLAYQWQDKKHRHVNDLCGKLKEAADGIAHRDTRIAQLEAERERMAGALEDARGIIEQIAPDFKFHVSKDSKLRRIERANLWLEKADEILEYSQ